MKKIILLAGALVAVVGGIAAFSAFEAHIINVTAHIENALGVSTNGIAFGTVFPQEKLEMPFTIRLSDSFQAQDKADQVAYKLVQKDKPWTLNFGGDDVNAHNRSLLCVDPDTDDLALRCVIADNVLTINTDTNKGVEDLFGPKETSSGTDWTAPRMVFPMGGNFTIETKVMANPTGFVGPNGQYQSGGILVYKDNGNVVRLELTKWGGDTTGPNSVYIESQEGGVKVGKGYSLNDIEADFVYLKLTRNGDVFKGFYKEAVADAWIEVPVQEGKTDFINQNIGGLPMIGLAATDNSAQANFSAKFDYVTFNGDYQNLCKFLSKTKDPAEREANDTDEPSYFVPAVAQGQPAHCLETPAPEATGILDRAGDISDKWNVDLKVPPVSGFVGQDWPASCSQYVVPQNAVDYGCDIWVEVTGITGR